MHGKAKRRRMNAAMLCADGSALQWTIDRYAGGQSGMAQSGSVTTAYICRVQANQLTTLPTSRLRTDCATVDHAYEVLSRGEAVVVAGSDMEALRQRLRAFEVVV